MRSTCIVHSRLSLNSFRPARGFFDLSSALQRRAPCVRALFPRMPREEDSNTRLCVVCVCARSREAGGAARWVPALCARCTGRAGLGEQNSRYLARAENNTPPFFLRMQEPTQARSAKTRTKAIRHTKANRNAPNTQETNHAARCSGAFTHPPAVCGGRPP